MGHFDEQFCDGLAPVYSMIVGPCGAGTYNERMSVKCACPYCTHEEDHRILFKTGTHEMVKCDHCGAEFVRRKECV